MPPLDFPNSPSVGQVYLNYTWDGEKWTSASNKGITDAPSDSILYGRKNAAWTVVPSGGAGTSLFVNIMDYGGDNTNTSDNSAALAAAFAALPVSAGPASGGGTIFFPTGTYKFTSTVTLTVGAANTRATLRLLGNAVMATQFYFPTNSGIVITTPGSFAQHQIHVEHIAFLAGQQGGGTALKLFNTGTNDDCNQQFVWLSSVVNCAFAPYNPQYTATSPNGTQASFWWGVGLEILAWKQVDISHCIFRGDWRNPATSSDNQPHGIGTWLHATGPQPSGLHYTQFGLLYNIDSCLWETLDIGLLYGGYIQGVTVSNCNFGQGGGGSAGIYIGGGVGDVLQSQLAISNTQFAWGSYGILGDTLCYQVSCMGCIFTAIYKNSICIQLNQSNLTQIVGNSFNCSWSATGNTTYGVVIDGVGNATVCDNTFVGLTTGYLWKPSTNHCKGQSNSFTNIWGNAYVNQGSSLTPGTAGP